MFSARHLASLLLAAWLATPAPALAASRHHHHHHHHHRPRADALAGPHTGSWRPHWWPGALKGGRRAVVIRLGEQRLYLQATRVHWAAFSVSTGARRPTPCGVFRVVEKLRAPDWSYKGQHVPGGIPGNPLGVCWLGLGMPPWWTGAPIGMHGTNAPWVIGHPASHGCIRLRNEDALMLYKWVPVGTPVWIMP